MFGGYTTADERNAVELRAEIARLIHINAKGSHDFYRLKQVVDWLESQGAVFTPEMCWTPGDGSLTERILARIAVGEMEEEPPC